MMWLAGAKIIQAALSVPPFAGDLRINAQAGTPVVDMSARIVMTCSVNHPQQPRILIPV
jgi:hypothetical protein